MPTLRELEARGISLSRFGHWLGQTGDPADIPERAWNDDRDPTEAEEREHEHGH